MALVLIGFMGAGKTTAVREAGGVDTDDLIAERHGEPVEALFDRVGEARFREIEEQVVLEALDSGAEVLALGGGAVLSPRVRERLRAGDHVVAWLEVDVETAWERAAHDGRPLARDPDTFGDRFAERQELYAALADAFVDATADPVPLDALTSVRPGERLILSRVHPVWFERPADERPGDFVVSDEHVAPLHAPGAFAIAAGEEHKTLATAQTLWTEMARRGVTRAGRVVAVGGGVVGDVAGFVAATYQRGVPIVHVPTTLVAQVDSAYGGKTAVDLPEAKNYVGAYHQPQAVHVLHATLATLPAPERAAGYAEVVKTALIAGGPLWERVRAGAVDDPDVVLACARTKLAVVAQDERDGGRRQVLNLGHTVGHAIEVAAGYGTYRHGEAVGLGLLAALRLSGASDLRGEVASLLAAQGLPTRMEHAEAAAVVAATRLDKKRLGDGTPFVLVGAPGDVTPGHEVGEAELSAAVAELA
ncbi:MAG TPA: bifunctional shikimate kinase/3-dehydroquinate synthase [Solirubrobacteraceae bacterium]|nr:bifunctional shikimate kinase/3-dehydroquinate synthase [Solirubrobacteraceae bacterium]